MPSIAIIHAGPAGLNLGRLLYLKQIPFTVCESDTSRHAHSQGGTLDLHPSTGQAALKHAGLWDSSLACAHFDGDAFLICDDQLNMAAAHVPAEEGEKPEIDRATLRDILLDSLPDSAIQWEKKLTSFTPTTRTLQFTDGSTAVADLTISADGGWSRMRPHLTRVKPYWTGAAYFSFRHENPGMDLLDLVNNGSIFAR